MTINLYQKSLIEKSNQLKEDFIATKKFSMEFNSLQTKTIQPKSICELLEKRISVLQELKTNLQALIATAQEFINNTNKIKEDYHQFSNPFTWQTVNGTGTV